LAAAWSAWPVPPPLKCQGIKEVLFRITEGKGSIRETLFRVKDQFIFFFTEDKTSRSFLICPPFLIIIVDDSCRQQVV